MAETPTTAESQAAPTNQQRLGAGSIKIGLEIVQIGPVLVLLLIAGVMALLQPLFLSERNIQNLLVQSSVIAILGLGQLLVIITRGIDLSVGATLALASVMGGVVASGGSLNGSAPVIVAIAATGAAVGLVNGVLFVKGRIPHPFIVTLAMLSVARGVAFLISEGNVSTDIPTDVLTLGQGYVGKVPVPVLLVVGIALCAHVLMRRMKWGRWIYAVGGNPEGARAVGIPVNKVLISVYVLCGLAAGLGAIITTGRTASGDPNAGNLAELDAIAAVIIGGGSFLGGRGTVGNVLIGALTIGAIRNGLDLLDVSPFLQFVVIGVTVLAAVQLDVIRTGLEGRLKIAKAALR